MTKRINCIHSLVDYDSDGVYGLEICRLCGQIFKDGEPIDEQEDDEE